MIFIRDRTRRLLQSRRWSSWWVFLGSKAAAVVAALMLAGALKADPVGYWLVAAAVLVYGCSFVTDYIVKTSEKARDTAATERANQARAAGVTATCASLTNIPAVNADFYDSVRDRTPDARSHLSRYLNDLLEALTHTVGDISDVRVCLYRADFTELDADDLDATPARASVSALLLHGNSHGRPDAPRPAFEAVSPHGRFIIDAMNGRKIVRVADTMAPPTNYPVDCAGKVYRSFFAVPVVHNQSEYGMLMLDSRHPDYFHGEHEAIANLYVKFLGVAFDLVSVSPAGLPRLSVENGTVSETHGTEG